MPSDEITVTLTLGTPGDGSETVELSPGESFSEITDGATYVEVDVPELPEGPDAVKVEAVSTESQDEDDDREWTVDYVKCVECGKRYPVDYSNCPECGVENKELEDLEP